MGILDGQPVDAANSNPAWLDANADDAALGKIGFHNAQPESGPNIDNTQRVQNRLMEATGVEENGNDGVTYSGVPGSTISDGDTHEEALVKLAQKFDGTNPPGHKHTGSPGEGPQVSAQDLAEYNDYWSVLQTTTLSNASGVDDDVTSEFSALDPDGGVSQEGVVTSAPYNRCELRSELQEDKIETPTGELVYGRITESSGTWTISYFYRDSSGVEQSYNLPTQDIRIYFRQVFRSSARPTFSYDAALIDSYDATADIVDATASQPGKVSTGSQTFGGEKTFQTGAQVRQFSLERVDLASGLNLTGMSTTYSYVKLTGSLATSLRGIAQPSRAVKILVNNSSTGDLTVYNEDVTAPDANRIVTPDGNDLTISQNHSVEFIYDIVQARWIVVSGVGGGGNLFQESLGNADGVITSFGPLTYLPTNEDSIAVFLDSILVDKSEWSLSGSDIVFPVAPAAGQSVYVVYSTNGASALPTPTGTFEVEYRTLTSGEIAAKQLTLSATPLSASKVMVDAIGGGAQEYSIDFTVSGAVLDWSGLGLDGLLSVGDKLRINYLS